MKIQLALTAALVAVVAFFSYRAGVWHAEMGKLAPAPVDVTILEQRIATVSELATVSYQYTDMARHEKSEYLWGRAIPLTTSRILLNYTGVIKAGMDLHKAKITVTNDTSILFVLPPPQILSHSIDPASFKIVDLDNAIFSSITIEDYNQFVSAHRDSIESLAIRNGLLDQARERSIESLDIVIGPLRDMGYNVTLETRTEEEPQGEIETPARS